MPVLNKDCPVGLEEEGRNLRLTHLIHWGRSLRVLLFERSNATTDARQVYRHGRIYMDAGGSSQNRRLESHALEYMPTSPRSLTSRGLIHRA